MWWAHSDEAPADTETDPHDFAVDEAEDEPSHDSEEQSGAHIGDGSLALVCGKYDHVC